MREKVDAVLIRALIFAAVCAGVAFGTVFVSKPSEPQKPLVVTMTHRDVIEIEYGKCWLVANTRKRTSYQSCADGG